MTPDDTKSDQSPDLREDESGPAPEKPDESGHHKPSAKTPAFNDDDGEVYVDEDP